MSKNSQQTPEEKNFLPITIYALLDWLVQGNNEFEETFLLFQVFVEIILTFEAFLKFNFARDEVKGQNKLQ